MPQEMISVQPRSPIPVTLIGGFLGAGKTTLLNHILSENHGVRAGVLVNDFGAINIDAKLVVGVEGETINLSNGCICCDIRDDLLSACLQLLHNSDPPERLIIEASGVSDPVQIANTFLNPELHLTLTLDNIFAVVDGEQFPGLIQGEMAALAQAQVRVADFVVLNKVDLISAERLVAVKVLVREAAPGSRILEATFGRIPLSLLLGTEECDADVRALQRSRQDSPRDDSPSHKNEHSRHFSTWHWTCDRPLSLPKLRATIEAIPDSVYRVKGIVYLEELPSYQIALQMVGKRSNLCDTEPWGAQPPRSEIVLIASRGTIDSAELNRMFEECIGTGDEANSPVLRLSRRLAVSTEVR